MEQQLPLKDIHIPEAVDWWPPAIGWWLLLILIPALIFMLWRLYRRIVRRTAVKSAKKILAAIKEDQQSDPLQKLQQLSALLRRVSISVTPREHCAGLTGADWLRHLDRSVKGSPFSEGVGRCLADAHFRKTAPDDVDLSALIGLCEQWLKGQKR
ncbi:DUF4381 domain-containing protein [Methylomarinum sp. Ch1-1]|uniref:DUF4381 domain-containing protein n=1 Tax=Methylomarinum roseum TaxID=3067653 RepID=A0AAU7NW94_9GAMM|nr:DUF4381 domain-containing protein [Methylomarinum sp. Ch1-1]MDP4522679.1 DUF4381 domain-containing protein [Methylomarinum sp. Ch1-1]